MRILIVGAGIAGLTLAALLQRQGESPTVIDRRHEDADLGYGLALWPHGSRVFHALGVHDAFIERSEPMSRYVARDGAGTELTSSSMPESIADYGHLGIIDRGDLLGILRDAADGLDLRDGVSIEHLTPRGEQVETVLSDGTEASFDLVVGADGIRSRVRELMLGRRIPDHDTGWGCYVWWADADLAAPGETTERWGAGSFLGTYPSRDQLCVIAGAPLETLRGDAADGVGRADGAGRAARLASLLRPYGVPVDRYLADLPADDEPLFLWRMADVRSPLWTDGRIALVGDAAAAFLPTAGIGASMALESAAALANELSRTDETYVAKALKLYERRRRRRVEGAQTQSRRLAKLMFVRSPVAAWARDQALRHATMEQVVGPLIKDLRRPI
ncbi:MULTISPECIES: FAD-dependent oxidoreductase [unclassified Brachybacterium]|uniref:FAD-dependent oxidoreductase n=1 Tax=unclassified Brachybacterium TaxID=2623841 RepID=UPI003607EA07